MSDTEALYDQTAPDRFRATEHTVGPWSPHAQHLGPVSALLVRALERFEPRPETALRRITVDVLGPVPVDEVTVLAEMLRPGRSVELLCATAQAGGRAVATARAWRMVRGDSAAVHGGQDPAFPDPREWPTMPLPEGWSGGFASALDWRIAEPETMGSGCVSTWARLRMPVVAGEEPSALQRLFAVTDCSSGVSGRASMTEWAFANTDLTVHLHRVPEGEWIGLRARTVLGEDGAGLASSTIHDLGGPVGQSAQSLLVAHR